MSYSYTRECTQALKLSIYKLKGLTMQSYNPIIAYHAKSERRGWSEVLRERADWTGWNTADKSMIDYLLQSGQYVVTLGWNMYQIVKE